MIKVEASEITPNIIKFECPQCWSKYKKNGEPAMRAKRITHIHGNETHSKDNRSTDRSGHCIVNDNPKLSDVAFDIHITDNTIRSGWE
tara:strand:- start:4033 stop:4296 length:264 start_codon:yes stop_codon:yes gene_type:complete